ncbi:MAG: hypothetical protein ACNS61_15135, partial [Candidatus Wenzhouxiangella sp. M2_3B_020]
RRPTGDHTPRVTKAEEKSAKRIQTDVVKGDKRSASTAEGPVSTSSAEGVTSEKATPHQPRTTEKAAARTTARQAAPETVRNAGASRSDAAEPVKTDAAAPADLRTADRAPAQDRSANSQQRTAVDVPSAKEPRLAADKQPAAEGEQKPAEQKPVEKKQDKGKQSSSANARTRQPQADAEVAAPKRPLAAGIDEPAAAARKRPAQPTSGQEPSTQEAPTRDPKQGSKAETAGAATAQRDGSRSQTRTSRPTATRPAHATPPSPDAPASPHTEKADAPLSPQQQSAAATDESKAQRTASFGRPDAAGETTNSTNSKDAPDAKESVRENGSARSRRGRQDGNQHSGGRQGQRRDESGSFQTAPRPAGQQTQESKPQSAGSFAQQMAAEDDAQTPTFTAPDASDAANGKIESSIGPSARSEMSSASPLGGGRRSAPPAAIRMALRQAAQTTVTADGWNVMEMDLGGDEGSLTIRTQRENDVVRVAVHFTDQNLQNLAANQADRIQQILQEHYDANVDFSLFSGDANQDGQAFGDEGRGGSAGGAGLSGSAEAESTGEVSRAGLDGITREWVG